MQTFPKKQIEIMIEAPAMNRVIEFLDSQDVSGYTVFPAIAGKGADGAWHRDGLVGPAGAVVQIVCILDEHRCDALLAPLFKMVKRQIGIVTVRDVEVIRPEGF